MNIEINNDLIRKMQLKATGANIHGVNEAIANYKAAIKIANGTAWWIKNKNDPKIQQNAIKTIEKWEKHMNQFLLTSKPKPYI